MGRIKVAELSERERQALEHEYRRGKTHSYRQRCKGVLLKSEQRTSAEVAKQLGCNEVTVNIWLKRYEQGGIEGLRNLSGRGRKPILNETDLDKVKEIVAEHRQKLSVAKEELEQALGKSFSHDTLKRDCKVVLGYVTFESASTSGFIPYTAQAAVRSPVASQANVITSSLTPS